jgi:phenylacetate-CoA ligase
MSEQALSDLDMDTYAKLFEGVLFPAWEGLARRRPTPELWRFVERTQWLPADELAAMQMGSLRRLLFHAEAHVPYYRDLLKKEGLYAGDIRTLDDFARLPPLRRADAQGAGMGRVSEVPPFPSIDKASSGTSGTPLSFRYDERSEHWRQALKLRGYGWAGHRPGAKTLHYWGVLPAREPPSLGKRTKVSVERLLKRDRFINCATRSEADLDHAIDVIRAWKPDVIICYSLAGGDLARHIDALGARDWPDIHVICAGEPLFPEDRHAMHRAFGPHVFDTYGCREVMLIGAECDQHSGLHLSTENVVVEIVVREGNTTRPARPGETGEVLLTDLHNFSMPFIRYANGDLAVAGPTERCACGRGLPRMAAVDGRVTDTLRDARGARVGGMVFITTVATVGHRLRMWQGVQHKDGSVTFRFVPGEGFNDAVEAHLQRSLYPYFGGFPVKMERVADIPVGPNGKRRPVVVERGGSPESQRATR